MGKIKKCHYFIYNCKGLNAEQIAKYKRNHWSILKSETSFKGGITDKQFKCLLDNSYLDLIVTNWTRS